MRDPVGVATCKEGTRKAQSEGLFFEFVASPQCVVLPVFAQGDYHRILYTMSMFV